MLSCLRLEGGNDDGMFPLVNSALGAIDRSFRAFTLAGVLQRRQLGSTLTWGSLNMPLFEISSGELVPFRRLKGGAELYEKEIEALVWADMEECTGETLFPIRR